MSKKRKTKPQKGDSRKNEAGKSAAAKGEARAARRNLPLIVGVVAVVAVVAFIAYRASSKSPSSRPVALTILHTNDTAGYVGPCG